MADLLLTKASDDYFIHTSPKTKSVKSPLLHHQGTFEILVVSMTLHAKKKNTSHEGKKSLPTKYKALTNCKLMNS